MRLISSEENVGGLAPTGSVKKNHPYVRLTLYNNYIDQNLNDGTGKACDWHQSTTFCLALRYILRLLSSMVVGALEPTGSVGNQAQCLAFHLIHLARSGTGRGRKGA